MAIFTSWGPTSVGRSISRIDSSPLRSSTRASINRQILGFTFRLMPRLSEQGRELLNLIFCPLFTTHLEGYINTRVTSRKVEHCFRRNLVTGRIPRALMSLAISLFPLNPSNRSIGRPRRMLTPKKKQSRINHQHCPRRKTTEVILSKHTSDPPLSNNALSPACNQPGAL